MTSTHGPDAARVCGITGTNGKTTTARWLAQILRRWSPPVLCASTVGVDLDGSVIDSHASRQGFAAAEESWRRGEASFAVLELTSQLLRDGFARRWPCGVAVFTNLSHDHLDVHHSLEEYLAAKAQLFLHLPPGGVAILNAADPASELLEEIVPAGVRIVRFAARPQVEPAVREIHLRADEVSLDREGARFRVTGSGPLASLEGPANIRVPGDLYVENALATLAAAIVLGVPADLAREALATAAPPPGRFEIVAAEPLVVVDFAHNPDGLARTLAVARQVASGRVILVFGAGGERDPDKREPMGRVARAADLVFLTNDNPRREDPEAIAAELRRGLGDHPLVSFVPDRAEAIRRAVSEARRGDLVLVAGKGHETGQQIGAVTLPFDDRRVAAEAARAVRDGGGE